MADDTTQLRKGALETAVLALLRTRPHYGGEVVVALGSTSVAVDPLHATILGWAGWPIAAVVAVVLLRVWLGGRGAPRPPARVTSSSASPR